MDSNNTLETFIGKNNVFEQSSLIDMTDEQRTAFYDSEEYKKLCATVGASEDADRKTKVQQILDLSANKRPYAFTHNSIRHIEVDLEVLDDIINESPVVMSTIQKGESTLPTFKNLFQDLYLSLIKYKPELTPEGDLHESAKINRSILNALINTPEYIKLRRICRMDIFNSVIAAEMLSNEITEALNKRLEENLDKQEIEKQKQALKDMIEQEKQMDKLAQENETIKEQMQQKAGSSNSQPQSNLEQLLQQNEISIETAKKLAEQAAKECQNFVQPEIAQAATNQISNNISDSLKKTTDKVQEVSRLCQAWGLVGSEGANNVPFQQKRDAVEKIRKSSKLKKFTNLIGRFKESAIAEQKKKSKDGAVELSSVTTGDSIQDILPSERINLSLKPTKADFYKRYLEKGLLIYSKESHSQKTKGPIIICVDTSGSMRGDKETWSKAITIGILEIAEIQKRDFACILYSDHAEDPIIIKKGEVSPEKVLKCAERFLGGGTNFERPLKKATELIQQSSFKDADIIFVTDGDCYVNSNFLKDYNCLKKQKEFKTRGILVNIGHGHCSDASLKEFCDDIVCVSDIADLTNENANVNKRIFGSL